MRSLLIASALAAATPAAGQSYKPRAGQPHPDFVLPRLGSRKPVTLSGFRGKKVLLIQFASW